MSAATPAVWRGNVNLVALWLKARRSPRFAGRVRPCQGPTYGLRWQGRSFSADAFVACILNAPGRAASLTLKPESPATDFKGDFQGLDLQRVE